MMLTRSQADNVSQALKFERHLKIYPKTRTTLAFPTPNANMFWRCVQFTHLRRRGSRTRTFRNHLRQSSRFPKDQARLAPKEKSVTPSLARTDVPSTHLNGRPSQDGIMSDEWCNISIGDSILAKKEKEKKGEISGRPLRSLSNLDIRPNSGTSTHFDCRID